METLLTPLSVLGAKTTKPKTIKIQSLPNIKNSNFKPQTFQKFHKTPLKGTLLFLSSFLTSEIAKALTYEEALQQSVTETPDFDLAGILALAGENPVIVAGAAAVVAVPLLVASLIGGGKSNKAWGVESAKGAYAKLGEEGYELVDIRALSEIKEVGGPDVRGLKKKCVSIVYKGDDKPGFLSKLGARFKDPENTTLFVLDKFDGNSELVAELVTANGFKAAYAIKDGAEGPRGWKNSGLPWIAPKKSFSFDLSNFTDGLGEVSDVASLGITVAAAVGLGLLAFTEVETILQVLGSAAIVQFASKKLLFAEDRKQTIQQIEEVLNTKVVPKELVGDIQQIGKALLPVSTTSKALPAPAQVNSAAVKKPEPILETNSVPPKVETVQEPTPTPTPEVNSVPKTEVKEPLPVVPRPSSPYPNYPDFKPPTSPIPSRP